MNKVICRAESVEARGRLGLHFDVSGLVGVEFDSDQGPSQKCVSKSGRMLVSLGR